MRALRDREFDPASPLQTKEGAQQALRVGKTTVDDFIAEGLLDAVVLKDDSRGAPRITRITTELIMRLIENRRRPPAAEPAQSTTA